MVYKIDNMTLNTSTKEKIDWSINWNFVGQLAVVLMVADYTMNLPKFAYLAAGATILWAVYWTNKI